MVIKFKHSGNLISKLPTKLLDKATFLGRNGTGYCTGLMLTEFNNSLQVQPITSKDTVGRCSIEVPKEDLQALIDALETIKEGRPRLTLTDGKKVTNKLLLELGLTQKRLREFEDMYSYEDWAQEAGECNTSLGYEEWLAHRIEYHQNQS